MIRILIVDDEPLVRDLLRATFERESGIEVVALAGTADEAIELARGLQPDLVMLDVRMPGGGAFATRSILQSAPATRVVALSGSEDDAVALEMLDAGATSYVVKSSHPSDLVDAVLRSARGERVLAPVVSSGVIDGLTNRIAASKHAEVERGEVLDRLRRVLRDRLFEPAFQPIVVLETREVAGYEALTRFTAEPRRGPHEWFADAAYAGLQVDLELATARDALEAFRSAGFPGFLSLNVSPVTLAPLLELLRPIGGGGGLVIEITEHAPIPDYEDVVTTLAGFRALGVRVAVDDAGAGFASLRHTLHLTPDFLKLDVSLTRDVDADDRRRALAAGMLGFATELGAAVVAEGIEREAEYDTLRALGVAYGQGYLLGRPETVTR